MAYQTLTFKITGVVPLLMHNGQLADPLNEWAKRLKAITGKRQKTDADLIEMARLEWYGGLYLDKGRPCIPGEVIESAMVQAARKQRLGKQAEAGIFCPSNFTLTFDGDDLTIDDMWAQNNHRLTAPARIKGARVMRTRPKLENWSASIELRYDDELLNEAQVVDLVHICGQNIGLMDWRPKFGRFEMTS